MSRVTLCGQHSKTEGKIFYFRLEIVEIVGTCHCIGPALSVFFSGALTLATLAPALNVLPILQDPVHPLPHFNRRWFLSCPTEPIHSDLCFFSTPNVLMVDSISWTFILAPGMSISPQGHCLIPPASPHPPRYTVGSI